MKNINLKLKLILIGVFVLLIPLAALGIISILQSTSALNDVMNDQLIKRTSELGDSIYNVLKKEKRFVRTIAISRDATEVFSRSVIESGIPDEERFAYLNRALVNIRNTKDLGEEYQVLWVADLNSIVRAASSPEYLELDLSDRDYLQIALNGEVNIGQAALNKVTGEPFIPVAAPIYNEEGEIAGAAAAILHFGFLWDLIKEATIGESGYAYVTDANGLFISHPDPSTLFETQLANLVGMEEIYRRFFARESGYENYVYKGEAKTAGFSIMDETNWVIFLTLPDDEFLAAPRTIRNILLIVAVLKFVFDENSSFP